MSTRIGGPAGPKVLFQRWEDVVFLHWSFEPRRLLDAAKLPQGVELDVRQGRAWLTVVLLNSRQNSFVRPSVSPRLPPFGQVNVRTYVRAGDLPGLWFLRIEVGAWPLAPVMDLAFGISTRPAWIRHRRDGDDLETRVRSGLGGRLLEGSFEILGAPRPVEAGSLDSWLLDRYAAFGRLPGARVVHSDVEHGPWRTAPLRGGLHHQALLRQLGVPVPSHPDLAHFTAPQDARLSLPHTVEAARKVRAAEVPAPVTARQPRVEGPGAP